MHFIILKFWAGLFFYLVRMTEKPMSILLLIISILLLIISCATFHSRVSVSFIHVRLGANRPRLQTFPPKHEANVSVHRMTSDASHTAVRCLILLSFLWFCGVFTLRLMSRGSLVNELVWPPEVPLWPLSPDELTAVSSEVRNARVCHVFCKFLDWLSLHVLVFGMSTGSTTASFGRVCPIDVRVCMKRGERRTSKTKRHIGWKDFIFYRWKTTVWFDVLW